MELENIVRQTALKIIEDDMKHSEKSAYIEKVYNERNLVGNIKLRSFWLLVTNELLFIEN